MAELTPVENAAAVHLAGRLANLRHPDGTEERFLHHSTFGQPDDVKERLQARGLHAAQAMVNELKEAGFTVSHQSEQQVPQQMQSVTMNCSHCGQKLLTLSDVRPDGSVSLSSFAAQQLLGGLNPNCPH